MDFNSIQALTFDCYGTLVDWESGILEGLKPVFAAHHLQLPDEEALALYAECEQAMEAGAYLTYREVLREVMRRIGQRLNFAPTEVETNALVASFPNWRPFPDTVAALRSLKTRYKLAIVSNVDDDLFAITSRYLETPFDAVITAQQVGSYKPSHRNFEAAIARIGLPRTGILHVAQSLYHDIVPAQELGLAHVWVTRRKGKTASGPTLHTDIKPELEVPDMKSLVLLLGLEA